MPGTAPKTPLRKRADQVKPFICKNLIVVLENPSDWKNIGTVIRNVNALGAEKVYVVDPNGKLDDDWHEMRKDKTLTRISASAVKWTFVKRFPSSESSIEHLAKNGFQSFVTSPHQKAKENIALDKGDFTKHKKLALWFGNENSGISDVALLHGDTCIQIPMFGIIESFNLATSTGIVLYEVTKQRRAFQLAAASKLQRKS